MIKRSSYKQYYRKNYSEHLPQSTKYYKNKAKKQKIANSDDSDITDSDTTGSILDTTSFMNEDCDADNLNISYDKKKSGISLGESDTEDTNNFRTEIGSDSYSTDSSAVQIGDCSFNDDSCSHEDCDCFEDCTYSNINNMPSSLRRYVENLEADTENEIIRSKFVVSKEEVLLGMLKISMEFFLPCSGIASLFQCFNSFFDEQILPDTRYFIDKLFNSNEHIEYHAICPSCKLYIDKFEWKDRTKFCTVCKKNVNLKDPSYCNYFVILDIKHEVSQLIQSNADYYNDIVSNTRVPNIFEDIYDGVKYKKFVNSLIDDKNNYVSCIFNTDGSPVFKSSKFSIWPIQININEVPVHERSKPITCGLWFGNNKPNMSIFLSSFVDSINRYSETGILCNINGEERYLKLYALCSCVDSPARAQMQGIIQFNGYYGCGWCLHPGEAFKHIVRNSIKYPLNEHQVEFRTEANTLEFMQEALGSNSVVYGVKEVSPLINLEKFDIIDGFFPDEMHCVALGVAKQITEYWIYRKKKPYSISKNDLYRIDNFVSSFKVPNQICRLSRALKDCKYWKAKEWENWLLYYSCPSLKEIPNFRKYLKHWELLVQAIHLLMNSSITIEGIKEAHELLKEFMYGCELYYSKDSMTYNVHQLLHLSQSVINWGPLWCHFGYPFESGNGYIVKTVQAGKGVISQICRYLNMKQSITALQKHVMHKKKNSPVINFCNSLHNNCTKKTIKPDSIRYFGRPTSIQPLLIETLLLSENSRGYNKIVKNKCIFKSRYVSCNRSDNSFAITKDGNYVRIEKFVLDSSKVKENVICQNIIVKNTFHSLYDIKEIVSIDNNRILIETNNLHKICVYMKVKNTKYLSAVPNMYWFN